MSPRFTMTEMTPDEAALFLAGLAQKTANNSRDWDNLREIIKTFIESAYKAGQANPVVDLQKSDESR